MAKRRCKFGRTKAGTCRKGPKRRRRTLSGALGRSRRRRRRR